MQLQLGHKFQILPCNRASSFWWLGITLGWKPFHPKERFVAKFWAGPVDIFQGHQSWQSWSYRWYNFTNWPQTLWLIVSLSYFTKLEQIAIERSASKSWSWFSSISTSAHQCISASAASVHQQEQRIGRIGASAGPTHQQDRRISRIGTSAGSVHQPGQRIRRISTSAWSAHQHDWHIFSISESAAWIHQQHQFISSIVHQQHQCINIILFWTNKRELVQGFCNPHQFNWTDFVEFSEILLSTSNKFVSTSRFLFYLLRSC